MCFSFLKSSRHPFASRLHTRLCGSLFPSTCQEKSQVSLMGKENILSPLQAGAAGDSGGIAPRFHLLREIRCCQLHPFLAFVAWYCSSFLATFASWLPSLCSVFCGDSPGVGPGTFGCPSGEASETRVSSVRNWTCLQIFQLLSGGKQKASRMLRKEVAEVVITLPVSFLLAQLLPSRVSIRVLARKVFGGGTTALFGADADFPSRQNIWKRLSFSVSPH